MRPPSDQRSRSPRSSSASPSAQLERLESLFRSSNNRDLLNAAETIDPARLTDAELSRLWVLRGSALYDLDDVDGAIESFKVAKDHAADASPELQFAVAFSLFTREGDLQSPTEALPALSELRQLAARIGSSDALSALHLAVSRREGMRGNYLDARRHMELARRLTHQGANLSTLCALDTVESSLEMVSGNLRHARSVAEQGLERALKANFTRYVVGCGINLSALAIWTGQAASAKAHTEQVLKLVPDSKRMRFCALDNLLQIALFESDVQRSRQLLTECAELSRALKARRRSWYELAHQATCAQFHEFCGNWDAVVDLVESVEPELTFRHWRALQAVMLCAKARALAHLQEHEHAQAALNIAEKCCPRGAIETLIVLEASKGLCLTARGVANGSTHVERALAAARAIGHRYHEWWIARAQALHPSPAPRRGTDLTTAALLVTDVATILGAGHSIDLLTHRATAVLETVFPPERIQVTNDAGREYRAEFSTSWEQAADGTVHLRVRGSDRAVSIRILRVQSLDELSLVKSVADVIRAAVQRTREGDADEEEQNLWPRSIAPGDEDHVFRSPRMEEIVKIAIRLATTELPVLLTGETGTGKEVLARIIHEHSHVKRGPFLAYNCSAMPRDLVESQLFGHRRGAFTGATDAFPGIIRAAEHGTLFLDEIGDLDPAIQPKLLRFLEGAEIHPIGELKPQRVPVRTIAATNARLDQLVQEGRFRNDLFYRIGVACIALPPLRERKDEIPALASMFATRFARECHRTGVQLGDDLIAALLLYDWPGNIRQLANEIRRIVAMAEDGQVLHSSDLARDITTVWNNRPTVPPAAGSDGVALAFDQPLEQAVQELERQFIDRAMKLSGGRVAEAAQLLGISRKGLFLKRRRWGLIQES